LPPLRAQSGDCRRVVMSGVVMSRVVIEQRPWVLRPAAKRLFQPDTAAAGVLAVGRATPTRAPGSHVEARAGSPP
jgi:hypothetical protein